LAFEVVVPTSKRPFLDSLRIADYSRVTFDGATLKHIIGNRSMELDTLRPLGHRNYRIR